MNLSTHLSLARCPAPKSFKASLFHSTALYTAGGKLSQERSPGSDSVTLSRQALAGSSKSKDGGFDPKRIPPALQRPLILVHGIRSGADTFTEKVEGQAPHAVDYLTRNKANIFGGTIVGVNAQGKLLVIPKPTPENPHPKPTTDVPAGANLFTIDLNKGSNTIAQNGGELRDAIEAITKVKDAADPKGGRSKVDIMGWSHGGLDGLKAAEMLGDRVAHLTTLGTPFKGTLVAPFHPILRALESFNIGHLFGPDPIRDELGFGSKALKDLLAQRDKAKGLKIMNVSGLGIDLGGGDGVVDRNSSQLDGAVHVNAHGYAHTKMHNAPDIIDQVVNFNNNDRVATDLHRSGGSLLDLVM